ncbi:hypothetical protein LINPERHAP1_LOCUS29181 [Linum perenne]
MPRSYSCAFCRRHGSVWESQRRGGCSAEEDISMLFGYFRTKG